VCLALHGRHSVAAVMVSLGLPEFLGAAVQAGSAPFAVVAVDGGDSYRVAQTPGDDPQAMLRTELPGWLTSFGLTAHGGVPTSVLGISAGCFGSMIVHGPLVSCDDSDDSDAPRCTHHPTRSSGTLVITPVP
jgi:hypothetical protein